MPKDLDLEIALAKAAETLLSRKITASEQAELLRRFKTATGSFHERALKSLEQQTNFSRKEINEKCASSTNTDRVMDDLKEVVTNWKPGS